MRSYYMYQSQMVDVHITVYRFCRSCHIWIVAFSALILIMIPRSYGQLVRHGKWYSDKYVRIMRPFICMTDDTKSLHRHYRHLTKWTHVYGTVRKIESLISDIFDKNIGSETTNTRPMDRNRRNRITMGTVHDAGAGATNERPGANEGAMATVATADVAHPGDTQKTSTPSDAHEDEQDESPDLEATMASESLLPPARQPMPSLLTGVDMNNRYFGGKRI